MISTRLCLSNQAATQEYVVPRSIPIAVFSTLPAIFKQVKGARLQRNDQCVMRRRY
ncbi:hypothetical protein HanPSC8_Chr14g0599301 [Helianthus annuus]|nr:hypothetical protein HanPSC8_Chr14g0599301 [Helianthus annuus]